MVKHFTNSSLFNTKIASLTPCWFNRRYLEFVCAQTFMSVETNLSRHFGVVFENKLELSVCSLPSPITSQIQILTRLPYFSPPLHPPNVTCLSVNQTSHNFCDKCCDNSLPVSPVISSCHHTRYWIVTGLSRNHIVTSI